MYANFTKIWSNESRIGGQNLTQMALPGCMETIQHHRAYSSGPNSLVRNS
ncbi:hypothetical protein F441_19034 [Phytophthora nicotianae CJ01A1]|uniref:Uncharacterized protein n=2 Tax=Phytophthora nicotianae TaxID=4792 RepID=W2I3U7_PHYNI|nr:hypothetical protein L915_18644 [Phytophthora nicotianae]ETL28038.1 hypothetical protein L916_18548 [Phytophthora nicotianae]ETP04149.1 hypothetical protein F441_19034 [Phytophthora nicotianae CJ01A1]